MRAHNIENAVANLVLLALALAPCPLAAQSFRGYLDVYIDTPTETIYVQGMNFDDPGMAYYYSSGLCVDLASLAPDGTRAWVRSACAAGNFGAEVMFQYSPAVGGYLYTATGNHEATADYLMRDVSDDCYYNNKCGYYWDIWGWSLMPQQQYPGSFTETPPYTPIEYISRTVHRAATTDSQSHSPCGNPSIDRVYGEYRDARYGTSFRPVCTDFRTNVSTANFSFGELNRSNDHQYGIFHAGLTGGVECVRTANGSTPLSINSAYRNPASNSRVGGATNSQHLNGTAVDFSALAGSNLREQSWNIKLACGPCREPLDLTPSWVHYDWRGGCPSGW